MSKYKIEVTKYGDRVSSVYIRRALGPWPFKNWSLIGIVCLSVEEAKLLIDKIESLPKELREYAFYVAKYDRNNLTEERIRTLMNQNKSRKEESIYI